MAVCDKCHSFKVFGKKCWFFWDCKKSCSQFKKHPEEDPGFASDDNFFSFFKKV